MEIQFHGANCISVSIKGARFVIDDNLKSLGAKEVAESDDNILFTFLPEKTPKSKLIITDPGEYEVSEVSIFGVGARAHMDEEGKESATMYKLVHDDIRIAITGHIHPDLSEDHLEELGAVDILIIPVGGNGYTLDSVGAQQVIKSIEPKVVIPTHYEDPELKYPVSQQPITEFLKATNSEDVEPVSKYKPKNTDFGEGTKTVVISK